MADGDDAPTGGAEKRLLTKAAASPPRRATWLALGCVTALVLVSTSLFIAEHATQPPPQKQHSKGPAAGPSTPPSQDAAAATVFEDDALLGLRPRGFAEPVRLAPTDVSALNATLSERATVLLPRDAGFAATSRPRNALFDTATPALIVVAATAGDVASAVRFARARRLRVSVFATGHDYDGRSTGDASVSINLSRMRWARFVTRPFFKDDDDDDDDPDAAEEAPTTTTTTVSSEYVSVGPGTPWLDVVRATLARDRIPVAGYDATVGVAGFTLGGGHGPLSRQHGLAADQLVAARVVDGAGEVWEVTEGDELLWALRGGGGGSFGVVVELVIRVHAAPRSYTQLGFEVPIDRRRPDALVAFLHNATWWRDLPRGWAGWASLQPACDDDASYPRLAGLFLYTANDDSAALPYPPEQGPAMRPFYDLVRRDGGSAHVERHDSLLYFEEHLGALRLGAGQRQFIGNVFVDEHALRGHALTDYVVDVAASMRDRRLCAHVVYYNLVLGGRVRDVPRLDAAVADGFRDAVFQVGPNAAWTDAARDAEHIAFSADVTRGLRAIASSSYINEWTSARGENAMVDWRERFWGAANYRRLLRVKRAVDPCHIFWVPHGVGSEDRAYETPGCVVDSE